MGVDSCEVGLEVHQPHGDYLHLVDGAGRVSPSVFGGLYQGGLNGSKSSQITVNADELMNLGGLIGTMSHELRIIVCWAKGGSAPKSSITS